MGEEHQVHRLDYCPAQPREEHVLVWFLKLLGGYIVLTTLSLIAAVLIFCAVVVVARAFGT